MRSGSLSAAAHLIAALDELEQIPCTRPDGNNCRLHYDTDLCPPCTVGLEIDRAYRALVGKWMGEPLKEDDE